MAAARPTLVPDQKTPHSELFQQWWNVATFHELQHAQRMIRRRLRRVRQLKFLAEVKQNFHVNFFDKLPTETQDRAIWERIIYQLFDAEEVEPDPDSHSPERTRLGFLYKEDHPEPPVVLSSQNEFVFREHFTEIEVVWETDLGGVACEFYLNDSKCEYEEIRDTLANVWNVPLEQVDSFLKAVGFLL